MAKWLRVPAEMTMNGTPCRAATPATSAGILLTGAALVGAGALVSLAGVALTGSALLAGTRRWMHQMDVPPRELAKQKLLKARAATSAGVDAWQNSSTPVHRLQRS
ncbi:hypothetical protein GCM10010411_82170 [Actinomadura fulvescens]|uniref:Uncharacterized protein n=2 Tax=Actinomadura fulvescens TaxID=46160 RepID=A0ABN3QNZ8_9ACTN